MQSPGTSGLVRLSLPARTDSARLLAAAIGAMIDRAAGVADPRAVSARLASLVELPFADAAEQARICGENTVAVDLTVECGQPSFTIALADLWEHTEQLPVSPPSQAETNGESLERAPARLGVGILLVRRLMDEVVYTPAADGNRWMLSKRLPLNDEVAGLPTTVRLDLPASYRYLNVVGACVAAMFEALALPADDGAGFELQLAVQETLVNIVDHAYPAERRDHDAGRIEVTLRLDPGQQRFIVETLDQGSVTFDLAAVPDTPEAPQPRSGLLTSSMLLFGSATLVNVGNYLFNLLLGRWLGPAAFADLSLIVTLFLVTSFLTAGLQMPTARFTALYVADRNLAAVANLRRWAARQAGWLGLGLLAIFAAGAPLWSQFFSTASLLPFVIFGLFVPFYLVQGVDRGVLQGRTRFSWLAVTYQVEMWSRLLISLLLVGLGWAVNGAVAGIGLSFVAAWLVARRVAVDLPAATALPPQVRREMLLFVGPVLVAQFGQILINNSDVLIVRHFFPAQSAGYYAALALTGRIVFFATWSVVTAMFPIVAQRHRRGESHRPLLYASLGGVLLVSLAIVAVVYLFPEPIVRVLFGQAYLSIAPLLWLYALATMFYALANVIISYRLSINNTGGTYLAIVAGVAQVGLLWLFHATLEQVVWVQVVLMAALFLALFAWDFSLHLRDRLRRQPAHGASVEGERA